MLISIMSQALRDAQLNSTNNIAKDIYTAMSLVNCDEFGES